MANVYAVTGFWQAGGAVEMALQLEAMEIGRMGRAGLDSFRKKHGLERESLFRPPPPHRRPTSRFAPPEVFRRAVAEVFRRRAPLVMPEKLSGSQVRKIVERIEEITEENVEIIAARLRAGVQREGFLDTAWANLLETIAQAGPLHLRAKVTELLAEIRREYSDALDLTATVVNQIGEHSLWRVLEEALKERDQGPVLETVALLFRLANQGGLSGIFDRLADHPNPRVRLAFYTILAEWPEMEGDRWVQFWMMNEAKNAVDLILADDERHLEFQQILRIFAMKGVEPAIAKLYEETQSPRPLFGTNAYLILSEVLLSQETTPTPLLDAIADEVLSFVVTNVDGTTVPQWMADVLSCAECLLARAQRGSERAQEALQNLDPSKLLSFISKKREVPRVRAFLAELKKYANPRRGLR